MDIILKHFPDSEVHRGPCPYSQHAEKEHWILLLKHHIQLICYTSLQELSSKRIESFFFSNVIIIIINIIGVCFIEVWIKKMKDPFFME